MESHTITSLCDENGHPQSKIYQNFVNTLHSDATRKVYQLALNRYMLRYNIQQIDELVKIPNKEIETMIIDRIVEMQNKEKLSVSSVNIVTNTIQHFYSMNDIVLNWKKIRKFIKTDIARNQDKAYTHDDIQKLVSIADLRMKMVFLVFASTGIRVDALHDIKLRNLTKIDNHNLYKVVIYEGFKEQYFVFTTPECASVIDQYLDYRKRSGEELNDDSYLLRESFDNSDLQQVKSNSRFVATATLRNIIRAYLVKAGIRENYPVYDNRKRHKKAQVHGFRKFVTGQFVNSKVNPEIREMLLGHKIGLASAYYRPTEEQMLNEYLKAVDNLTINEENRLKKKVTELEQKQDEITLMKFKHQKEIDSIREQMDKKFNNILSLLQKAPQLAQVKPEILLEKITD